MMMGGLKVIVSDALYEWDTWQTRFPRSRKRRIRKKWSRDKRNWTSTRKPLAYRMGDKII